MRKIGTNGEVPFFMFCTYILKLIDNSYYIGNTNDLENRLQYHRAGRVKSTKHKLPFIVAYVEYFDSRNDSHAREYQIKKWKSRKAVERLINKKD